MKNLGKKDRMYPSTVEPEKSKIRYPSATLPLTMLDGKDIDLAQEVTLHLKGKVTRVEKSEYCNEFSVELKEGEVIAPKAKNKTLIG